MNLFGWLRGKPNQQSKRSPISFVRDWYRADAGWGWGFHPEVGTLAPSTSAGVTVNPYTVMSHPVVWQAVNMIANDVAAIPLYKMTAEQIEGSTIVGKKRDIAHRVDRLFNERPNHFQTPYQFKRTLMHDVLLWGNFCALPVTDDYGEQALHPLPPSATYVREYEPGSQEFFIQTIYRNKWQVFPYDEVFHVSSLPGHHAGTSYQVGGIWGYSPTQVLRDALGAGLAMQAHQNTTFANGGQPSGVIESENDRDGAGHENLRKEWEEVHNSPGRVAILWDGMVYKPIPMTSNHDAQLVDLRKLDREFIASVYNLPVQKLNGLENAASSANVAEANKYYLYQTLTDWTEPIRQEAERKLFSRFEQMQTINVTDGPRVRRNSMAWDYDTFLREDRKTRYETYAIAVANKIMNPNECRHEEKMPPYEGGDEYENPAPGADAGQEGFNGQGGTENGGGGQEEQSAAALLRNRLNGHAIRN